jgi:3-phenylpropionate/cinnamic acid dioxygenase small subunit
MSTRAGIENTLYRYAWTYDMDELDGIGEVFTEDAEVTFGTGTKIGRDDVVVEMRRRREKYRPDNSLPWHVITNVFIRRETPDEADVVSFWTFFIKPETGPPTLKGVGYYDDFFVREGDTWRVKRRVVSYPR